MHLKGISHRDIKLENIFISKSLAPKLGDFGFATKKIVCNKVKGTVGYFTPEMIKNTQYDP